MNARFFLVAAALAVWHPAPPVDAEEFGEGNSEETEESSESENQPTDQ